MTGDCRISASSRDSFVSYQIAGPILQLEPKCGGDANDLQAQVAEVFRNLGYHVDWEVLVIDRGDGRPGYLDLVARKYGFTIAAELDSAKPRKKSLLKLRAYPANFRLIVLRKSLEPTPEPPEGIDLVLGLGWIDSWRPV